MSRRSHLLRTVAALAVLVLASGCSLLKATQCNGSDIQDGGKVTSADACCTLCSTTQGCGAFTFNEGIDHHCWLKTTCSKVVGDSRFISGTMSKPAPIGPYTRTHSVTNDTFLSFFDFFDGSDPTHGFVDFVDEGEALASGLLRLADGQIAMSADRQNDTTTGRRSVRVQSKSSFNGFIMVIDLEHMPTGCGTWPAFWTVGPQWPNGGEIDIIEGVHKQTHDQTTLHSSDGCDMSGVDPSSFTGSWGKGKNGQNGTNCYVQAPGEWGNAGCGIANGDDHSMGAGFNAQKGGVYATLWDLQGGVRAWNWPRRQAPADIRTDPQPDTWGLPYARFDFAPATCDGAHFRDHSVVFDLTFCGDWAGGVFAGQCPDVGTDSCSDYVGKADNVQEAYWIVNYVDIWERS